LDELKFQVKAKANKLEPFLLIGKNKVNEKQIAMLEKKLEKEKIVKIKLQKSIKEEKQAIAKEIAEKTHSVIAEIKGNTIVLFRS